MSAKLVQDGLAVYRLTRLVVEDEIVRDVREKFWEKFPPERTKLGYLSTCPWCVSVWAGLGVAVARRAAPRAWDAVSFALAASAVTGLIEEKR